MIEEGKLNFLSYCKHRCAGGDYSIAMPYFFELLHRVLLGLDPYGK